MAEEEFIVAVDVGGTLTKIAYADPTGALTGSARLSTHLAEGGAGLVPWLAATIRRWVDQRPGDRCLGYGVVVPGIVDAANGTVRAAPNVDWVDVPLRDQLTELTGLPGAGGPRRTLRRARRMATGQRGGRRQSALPVHRYGHRRGHGGGRPDARRGRLRRRDRPHPGDRSRGSALCVWPGRLSGDAGLGRWRGPDVRPPGRHGRLGRFAGRERIGADQVANLARSGDPSAQQAFDRATAALTEALINYVTLLGPELIVIGGGLSGAADLFVPQVVDAMATTMTFQRVPRIVTANLGADAGVIGAGLVGWDRIVDRSERASLD